MRVHWIYSHTRNSRIRSKSTDEKEPELSYSLQFWLLLVFAVPSLICSVCVMYHYLSGKVKRRALHNHVILLIITTNILLILTDVSWMLDNFRQSGRVLSPTPSFCLMWWFLDMSLYVSQTMILAWASIDRHILIFHSSMLSTKRKRLLYHYLPLCLLIAYTFTFYGIVIFSPPCENHLDYSSIQCGYHPCYWDNRFLSVWEAMVNSTLPTLIIAIFSVALLYRAIHHKKRLRQPIQWRKHRRMSIQLVVLSGVYLFLNLPLTVIMLVQFLGNGNPSFSFGAQLYVFCLNYSVTLSLPFVVCLNYVSIKNSVNQRVAPLFNRFLHHQMFAPNVALIE